MQNQQKISMNYPVHKNEIFGCFATPSTVHHNQHQAPFARSKNQSQLTNILDLN